MITETRITVACGYKGERWGVVWGRYWKKAAQKVFQIMTKSYILLCCLLPSFIKMHWSLYLWIFHHLIKIITNLKTIINVQVLILQLGIEYLILSKNYSTFSNLLLSVHKHQLWYLASTFLTMAIFSHSVGLGTLDLPCLNLPLSGR